MNGLGRTLSIALVGLNGYLVEVEADIGQTLPAFQLLGLPDASLVEAKERIRSAAQNAGLPLSRRKITVNLLPASLPKHGSSFDLAIAMAALQAAADVHDPGHTVFLAELGLDGRLRPIRGVLPAVLFAVQAGYPVVVVAPANAAEARFVPGAEVSTFTSLAQVALAYGAKSAELNLNLETIAVTEPRAAPVAVSGDLNEVAGQHEAKAALEVAAAGGHHLLLVGPPGAGKTMLAERLTGLLPDLSDAEAMEVTAVHSLDGLNGNRQQLIRRPPFESPHHTASTVSIIGGGNGLPRPGAASRAHRGVLFLDEAPEYDRRVLDALRQPLESGRLVIHRAAGVADYPARFQLVLAANPCPCGKSVGRSLDCSCTPTARRRYFHRLSGPLLDRVDVQLTVDRLSSSQLADSAQSESTKVVAQRVARARDRARHRLGTYGYSLNSEAPGQLLRGALQLPPSTIRVLALALERGRLTARGYDRVLRLAWTLADLAELDEPGAEQIGRALAMRTQGLSER
ncbi:YifB family Mg chelatase-like AAA ATPase [Psychromicrobium lacuslunae]|uniref:Mg chelatase-like protein n=1 Tax=Psychromicrobium lacuslunae TaxID=1618207 RepID=A0A0D4BYN4_9MICC|nr:YifB family Mg chelatase-like AAA ATPase [Psychromicrobium lacuslunae]AJT41211.1 Mg chelatase-like protein [Psychromicrobium lacuslunae]